MEVILMERIARLGGVGDVVNVKNGFARNYLIPSEKALRASKANKELFESRRAVLVAQNDERKAEAEKMAASMGEVIVTVVRQASDDGKLYGSVAVRDVSDALEAEGHTVDRRLIDLNQAIKNLGLYEVTVSLHPEVPVVVKVHVARNADSPIPQELLEEDEPEQVFAAPAEADAEEETSNDEVTSEDAAADEEAAQA